MCDNKDDIRQALYHALKCLAKIGEIAEEVSAHNYLDNTTIDLCADIGLEIESAFECFKDEAPEMFREYAEEVGQALAEESHP